MNESAKKKSLNKNLLIFIRFKQIIERHDFIICGKIVDSAHYSIEITFRVDVAVGQQRFQILHSFEIHKSK